jgi:hypothetical protein
MAIPTARDKDIVPARCESMDTASRRRSALDFTGNISSCHRRGINLKKVIQNTYPAKTIVTDSIYFKFSDVKRVQGQKDLTY